MLSAGLTIALLSCFLADTPPAEASDLRCNDTNIMVYAPDLADARSVCDGAVDAIRFLRARGLRTNQIFDVRVVDKLPSPIGPSAFGGYVQTERRAYLLMSSKIAERGTVFNLPFDRALYRSLATHEVAHAISALNFRVANPPIEAVEYIAYTTMFSSLPRKYRNAALERFKNDEFANELRINRSVYLLDPFRFGLLAYKHFMTLGNGTRFLEQVLTGRALQDFTY